MVVCSALLIVSFITIYCTVITEEITNEDSVIIIEKTISNLCTNPEDFPLFGTNSCISPALYTGLFLTSIILAGITFLMIIGLFLSLCIQRITRSYSNYYNNDESRIPHHLNHDNNNGKTAITATKPDKEISNVLRKIVSKSPLEGSNQTHIHHSFPIPTLQESLIASSNSHIDSPSIERQLQRMSTIQTVSESYELSTQKSTKRSSIKRKNSTNSYEYKRKYSTKL